jgi:acetoin utilization protein AcuB
MFVRQRMTPNPVTIGPHAMLSEAQEKMTAGHFRRLPVMDAGTLVGILTDRDVRRHWGSEERTKVQAAMIETPLTIPPDMPIEEATQLMLRDQISGLPVVENGKLIGIVTTSDILKAFLDVTGASTPDSTRINLLLTDKQNLVEVTQIIHEANGQILAVGTYEEPTSHQRAYFLRVAGADAAKATAALRQKGYSLL